MQTMSDQVYQIRTDEPAAVLEATFAPRHKDSPEGDGVHHCSGVLVG